MIVVCEKCGAKYRVPESKRGVEFPCNHCATTLKYAEEPRTEGNAPSAEDDAPPERLHYLINSRTHMRLPLDQPSYFGRNLDCYILLEGTQVSREHAKLQWNGHGMMLEDLNSRNGTFVNGKRIDSVILQDDDTIQIGSQTFTYRILKDKKEVRDSVRLLRNRSRLSETDVSANPTGALPSTDFTGNLATTHIQEVCQLLSLGHRTGRLNIFDSESRKGLVFFESGNIVHAEYSPHRGEGAVQAMLLITGGEFSFQSGIKSNEKTVESNTAFLLLESARHKDEK